jgi:hypothetical protein
MGRNEGVRISGGTIEAGALAVGRGARATNLVEAASRTLEARGQAELARRLEELIHALDEHASELANAAELREATDVVAQELAKERPNKTTVSGVLAGIAGDVQSVAGLATAAGALAHAVAAFL